ncbi:hypothetical protein JHK84_028015 [Glycine max]|nr:hypothetical protein JHK85_028422 [Glycine max]KAG5003760.1 hypothetical protein JHK86_027899 [Glycine max]KAG5151543.1 hypothetical protein JHK84_028015 [Glycine max]
MKTLKTAVDGKNGEETPKWIEVKSHVQSKGYECGYYMMHWMWNIVKGDLKNDWSMVMIHFSAYWCMPSIVMNHFFQQLASTYHNVLFLNVDVDEVKEVASKLKIKAIPTFCLMNGGAPMDKIVGANPDELRKRISCFIHHKHSPKSV